MKTGNLMIKRIYRRAVLGVSAAFLFGGQLVADVLYYDGFYDLQASTSLIGGSGGYGWSESNNWFRVGATGTAQVMEESPSAGFNTGNYVLVTPSGVTGSFRRNLTTPIDSGTLYVSAYIKNVNLGNGFMGVGLRNTSGTEC